METLLYKIYCREWVAYNRLPKAVATDNDKKKGVLSPPFKSYYIFAQLGLSVKNESAFPNAFLDVLG